MEIGPEIVVAVGGAAVLAAMAFRYLIGTLIKLNDELQEAIAERRQREDERQALQARIAELESQLAAMRVRLEDQARQIAALREQLQASEALIARLRTQGRLTGETP